MPPIPDFRIPRSSTVGLSDKDLCSAVVEEIWPWEGDDELAKLAAGTPGQRAIYTGTVFAREVDNGGLSQFFWNSSGDLYQEVLQGLTRLGASNKAMSLQKAARFFGDEETIPERSIRQAKLDATPREERKARLDPFDDELYGEKGSLEDELLPIFRQYIDRFPDEFFREP
jgi:hypothetical protein